MPYLYIKNYLNQPENPPLHRTGFQLSKLSPLHTHSYWDFLGSDSCCKKMFYKINKP